MSQRCLNTLCQDRPVVVTLGWDRPLQYFHLVVRYEQPDETEDDVLYSNLDDPDGSFVRSLDYYQAIVARLGITVPVTLWADTLQDSLHNVGNKVVFYAQDGSVQQEFA